MMILSAAAVGSPWAGCTSRAPPNYGASPQDHVQLPQRPNVDLQVATGGVAPDFSLARANATDTQITLASLLATKGVMLQFGSYT